MVDKQEIMRLLNQYFKTTSTITISDEGLVSCTGNVELKRELKHERLPVSFDRVDGDFRCIVNKLATLEGAPKNVGGSFVCDINRLTSLEHAPQSVGGDFYCTSNQLTSLEHAPRSVGGEFSCSLNQLTTLKGLPALQGTLYLSYSPNLPLLRCLLAKKVEFYPGLRDKTLETILNHYAGQGRAGAIDCKRELASAGFEGNARW